MNIGLLLSKSAVVYPEKLSIVYGEDETTYEHLNNRVNGLVNALLELGVKHGECVATWQSNCPQLIESLFACFKTGIVSVPMNARLHPREISYIVNHSESRAIIFEEKFKDSIITVEKDIPFVEHFICLSNPSKEMLDYEKLILEHSSEESCIDVHPDDLAWLFYTSGTTGKPKGAMLTHRNLMVMAMNFYADLYPLQPEDIVFHAAPLTHGSGLYILPALAKGATNIIFRPSSFDPELIFETIEREKITVFAFLTPTMIKMLMSSPEIDNYDLSSLKCIIYGGAPMYVEDLKETVRKFGRILVQLYGQGEAPMTLTYLRKEDHITEGPPDQLERLSSAGIARTDLEVKIFDGNDNELQPDEMGEIVARGEVVMKGYFKNPTATEETLRNGWLHTGDIGYVDKRGYVFIKDRKKDLIISGGANIYPREVEDVILRHPAVHEVAVIGVSDPLWGESVKAFIVLKKNKDATDQEIINFCKEQIASYKKPKSVDFIEELPKSAYGKILKRKLKEEYST